MNRWQSPFPFPIRVRPGWGQAIRLPNFFDSDQTIAKPVRARGGTDDRFVSSVTQGLRPAKFHEKVGALHLKPTFWQILGRHMFSMSYTGFSTLSFAEFNRKERVGIVSGRVVIVRLQQDAAVHRFERPMQHTGRSAGVGVGGETLSILAFLIVADVEVARDQIHLFPVFMDE